jgi:hypothetical protein
MVTRYKPAPARKHGAYSESILLPGEDPAAFKRLHSDLIAEFAPIGALEDDIVLTIAQHVWRKQNLATYRMAERGKAQLAALQPPPESLARLSLTEDNYAELSAKEDELRRELGESWELVEMGSVSTIDYAMKESIIIDRLDGMIDRCLKRLLLVRGLKSIASSEPASTKHVKKIAAA